MQVIIEEVVSRIRATSAQAALSSQTIGLIVSAVMEAIEADRLRGERRSEETSLDNHQQRVRPGR